ncbi:Ribosomal protein L47 mitochondrial [Venturia nashicola]|nr:Ribosomal protein L47 mitochondrial [Venturia nashicola]
MHRDNNRRRGYSAIRAKGKPQRFRLIRASELPKPVLEQEELTTPTTDHGLMGFFNEKGTLLSDPADDSEHGRGWTVEELSVKTWEEMHYIWWKCMKERNRLATERVERQRLKPGYGQYEADERLRAVQATMRAVRETLLERSYAQADAAELAKVDPEIEYDPIKNTYRFLGETKEKGDMSPLA